MTKVRRTSRDAYYAIKEQGLLSEQRMMVYAALFKYGPATAGELAFSMDANGSKARKETRYVVSRRLPELRDRGVACELGTRRCKRRNRDAIVWSVTNELPKKPPAKESRMAAYERTISRQQEVIKALNGLVRRIRKGKQCR